MAVAVSLAAIGLCGSTASAASKTDPAEARAIPADAPVRAYRDDKIVQPFADGSPVTRVIVTLRPPTGKRSPTRWNDATAARAFRDANKAAGNRVLSRLPSGEFTVRYQYDNIPGFSAEVTSAGLAALLNDKEVLSIEPVEVFKGNSDRQALPLINGICVRVPYFNYVGQWVGVAVVDTGVDYTHPQLGGGGFPNSLVVGGYDFVDNDADPYPSGGEAHGTAVSGIIAGALAEVGDYIGGLAYGARLYGLRAGDANGQFTEDAILASWNWCITHQWDNPSNPIMIVNNSFGGVWPYNESCEDQFPAMAQVVSAAESAGITMFMASGNEGFCDALSAPACLPNVVSVGAFFDGTFGTQIYCVDLACCQYLDPTPYLNAICNKYEWDGCPSGYELGHEFTWPGLITAYTNRGGQLSVVAPSDFSSVTDIAGASGYSSGDFFDHFNGTSAACPYAAAAGAIIQGTARGKFGSFLRPDQVKDILITTGDPVGDEAFDEYNTGSVGPRINVGRAVQMVLDMDPEIAVSGTNATPIADGDTTPRTEDGTLYGTAATVSTGITHTFFIANFGDAPLNLSSITFAGANPADFSLVGGFPQEVDAESTITISVRFLPTGAGTRSAVMVIQNGDASENPYEIALQGTGIINPALSVSATALTVTAAQGGVPASQTFTVQNTGGGTLNYSVSDNQAWMSVNPTSGSSTGEADTITVSFNLTGLAPGTYNGTISVFGSGASNSPRQIPVVLTVTASPVAACAERYECFVQRQYLDFFGATADEAGTTFWAEAICGGAVSPAGMVKTFVDLTEQYTDRDFVARAYMGLYNNNYISNYATAGYQAPGKQVLASWNNAIAAAVAGGQSPADAKLTVVKSFIQGSGFISRAASRDNSSFVDYAYKNILGRLPDSGSKSAFVQQLNSGTIGRAKLALSLIESEEAVGKYRKLVRLLLSYNGLLARKPTPSEIAEIGTALYNGQQTIVGQIQVVLGSYEYRTRLSNLGCSGWGASTSSSRSVGAGGDAAQAALAAQTADYLGFAPAPASSTK